MFSSIHIEYEWDQVNKQTKTHCVHFFIRPFIASFLTCLSPRHTTPPLPSSAAQFYSLLRWKHWSSSLELLSTLIHRRYKTADTEVSSQHTVGSGEALSLFDLSFYFFLQMEVIFVQFMMIIQLAAEKTTPKANKTTWMKTRLPSSDTHSLLQTHTGTHIRTVRASAHTPSAADVTLQKKLFSRCPQCVMWTDEAVQTERRGGKGISQLHWTHHTHGARRDRTAQRQGAERGGGVSEVEQRGYKPAMTVWGCLSLLFPSNLWSRALP